MTFSRSQQVALAIIPKLSACFSLFGSCSILREILILDRRRLKRVYNRLLLVMSLCDVLESIFNFLSSWPIPRGTPNVAFAVGNTALCEAQGFVLQFGIAIPILNTCLAIYYLLVIRYAWEEEQIAMIAEPLFHITTLAVTLTTCSLGIANKLFNNSNLWCWYAPYPLDCKDSARFGEQADCIRGDNAWIYRLAAYYIPLWICIIAVMVIMGIIYTYISRLEKASNAYLAPYDKRNEALDNPPKKKSKARRVASQALYYVGAFYLTFTFATVNRLVQFFTQQTYFPLILIHAMLDPAQGFANYVVYLRPQFLEAREANPDAPFWAVIRMVCAWEPNLKAQYPHNVDGDSMYIGQDHQDEEEARQEVARWRLVLLRRLRRMSNTLRRSQARIMSALGSISDHRYFESRGDSVRDHNEQLDDGSDQESKDGSNRFRLESSAEYFPFNGGRPTCTIAIEKLDQSEAYFESDVVSEPEEDRGEEHHPTAAELETSTTDRSEDVRENKDEK